MNEAERLLKAERSAARGAEAAQLLAHPLFQEIMDAQIESVTQALIALPVAANEDRLALVTVLGVLRKFKGQLESIKADGAFDAVQAAQLKEKQNA